MIKDIVLLAIGAAIGQIPAVAIYVKAKLAKTAPVVAQAEAAVQAEVKKVV